MPKFLCLLVLLGAALSAPAQQSPSTPLAGWARVQALPAGTTVHIRTQTGKQSGKQIARTTCIVSSVDADTLTCRGAAARTFSRSDIDRITVAHRGRSIVAGAAIGAGGGAVIGAATGRNGGFFPRGDVAAVLAVPGALIGGIIGASTDFTHSTIYRAH